MPLWTWSPSPAQTPPWNTQGTRTGTDLGHTGTWDTRLPWAHTGIQGTLGSRAHSGIQHRHTSAAALSFIAHEATGAGRAVPSPEASQVPSPQAPGHRDTDTPGLSPARTGRDTSDIQVMLPPPQPGRQQKNTGAWAEPRIGAKAGRALAVPGAPGAAVEHQLRAETT